MARYVRREDIDGDDCARIPLGRKGKYGSCIMLWESWENYLANNHSEKLRLIGTMVANGSNQSVAKILLEAGDNQRVEYVNGNSLDLRIKNLSTKAGKSGARIAPRTPKQKRHMQLPMELIEVVVSDQPLQKVPEFGFHELALATPRDRLDKWVKQMAKDGHILRDPAVAKKEIYLMKEQERSLSIKHADNYNQATGGRRSKGGKIKRFGKE